MDDTPMVLRRPRWRTWAVGVVCGLAAAYALVGIVGCVLAYRQVDAAEDAIRARLRGLGRTTAQATMSLRVSAAAAASTADTAATARDSLGDVTRTLNESAATFEEIAGAINFTIPFSNTRPLAGVDERFRTQARQLRAIAGQVGGTRGALDRNAADVRRIADEVAVLATQTDLVARELALFADEPNTGLPALARGVRVAFIWVGLLHVVLFAMSGALALLLLDPHLRGPRLAAPVATADREPDGGVIAVAPGAEREEVQVAPPRDSERVREARQDVAPEAKEGSAMTIVNWRDVAAKVSHGGGESRSLLQGTMRAGAAHPVLHTLGFVNRSRLAAGARHEAHAHDDHEEVFYIVGGRGAVQYGDDTLPVREGDAIYVPVGTTHGLINDSDDWLDFLAIGGSSQQPAVSSH